MNRRIAVIGTGYVGLTTGAYLAHLGHDVICADMVPEKIDMLNKGKLPIYEPGLEELVREGIERGQLTFVLGAANAVPEAEFVFLCVQTPQGEDGSADMTYVSDAAAEVAPALAREAIVINKSTVPVGSTHVVERALARDDVFVVSNPEFLREGSAVHDCLNPDRIVIGSEDQAAAMRVAKLFEGLKAPLVITDPASAETIKYASNAFLASKVSFVNALAHVCEAVGADVREVVLGMGYDKRIGFEFLRPGPGWGGSCFVPDETLLVRREGQTRLLSFEQLFEEVERLGATGWAAYSWRPMETRPEFLPIATFTKRPYEGDVVEIRTKMGRRLTVTADHGVLVCDGIDEESAYRAERVMASYVTTAHWVPIAQGYPLTPANWDRSAPLEPAQPSQNEVSTEIWDGTEDEKRAFVDRVFGGALSVELHDARLADTVLRLLGDLCEVASVVVDDATAVASMTRSVPTGYRRFSKNAAWVRVASTVRRPYSGDVYSVHVPGSETVVTTGGFTTAQCFPKDTRALVKIAEDAGYDFDLLRGVISVNDEQYERMAMKVEQMAGGSLQNVVVAAWGLAFKARTDDLRDSPAIEVIRRLQRRGATVRAYDPAITGQRPTLDGIDVHDDPYAPCEGADVLVVLTEWDEFRWLDFAKVAGLMRSPRIVDTRNLLEPPTVRRRGFEYEGVGRA